MRDFFIDLLRKIKIIQTLTDLENPLQLMLLSVIIQIMPQTKNKQHIVSCYIDYMIYY